MKTNKLLLSLIGTLICSTSSGVQSKDNCNSIIVKPLPLLERSEGPNASSFALADFKILVTKKASLDLLERMDEGSIYRESARILKSTKLLRKNKDQTSEIVAVVVEGNDGKYSLNPEINTAAMTVEYSKFPKISDFSPSTCEHLWGKPTIKKDVFQYVLVDSNDASAYYLVETVFKNNKLSQYRVSNSGTNGGAWSEVKDGE